LAWKINQGGKTVALNNATVKAGIDKLTGIVDTIRKDVDEAIPIVESVAADVPGIGSAVSAALATAKLAFDGLDTALDDVDKFIDAAG
jgi:hypothetical protein